MEFPQPVRVPAPPGVNADQAAISLMVIGHFSVRSNHFLPSGNGRDLPQRPQVQNGHQVRDGQSVSPLFAFPLIITFKTSLRVPCSPELFALCSYELGKLLWLYTRNLELAQFHLRNAVGSPRERGIKDHLPPSSTS